MEEDKLKEIKEKGKAFFKNTFGVGSSKSTQLFKGQGHRLGGSSGPPIYGTNPTGACSQTGTPPTTGGSNLLYDGRGSTSRKMGPGSNQQQQQHDLRRWQQQKWERERGLAPVQSSINHLDAVGASHPNRVRSHQSHVIQSVDTRASAAASVKSSTSDGIFVGLERESRETVKVGNLIPSYVTSNPSRHDVSPQFDPYSSTIAAGTTHRPSVAALRETTTVDQGKFQCPICQQWWQSEEQVSAHIDNCSGVVGTSKLAGLSIGHSAPDRSERQFEQKVITELDLDDSVAIFLSGGPSTATISVILRIFGDILKDPSNEKCRKLRLGNPKLKETVGSAIGGWSFLENFGFRLVMEGNDKFCLMGHPTTEQQGLMQAAIGYLDSYSSAHNSARTATPAHPVSNNINNIDRQMRVFYASNDRMEERFELPSSFYNLSASEVKSEVAARRKKREDSQLLIPKSFKEKQAALARQRYKLAVVRVQLPDGLVIQGFFRPGEPTSSLYEFVASTLKDGGLTFDLVLPAATKLRIIPALPESSGRCPTLEEVDLVPTALLKFRPTGPQGYTCLNSDCYRLCEPLTLTTLLVPDDIPKN